MIGAQSSQPIRNIVLGQPLDFSGGRLLPQRLKTLGSNELNCSGAVLSNMTDEPKDVLGRNLKTASPIFQDAIIVRQQSPKEWRKLTARS